MRAKLSALLVGLAICSFGQANAAVVFEAESNGTATNNTLGTAQAISGASFTTPAPPTVFDAPGYRTATVMGAGSGEDVDFYSFSSLGGSVFFDMDNIPFLFDPILSLFDSSGTLLAFNDDSSGDPGSVHPFDAFLGVYTLPGPGTYYIAVSTFANFANGSDSSSIFTPLTRPDGAFGGFAVGDPTVGDSSFGISGVQTGEAYTLHITFVPEPASLTLWGLAALGCVVGAYRRCKPA